MRNALEIGNGFIVTTDNSGGIGEKADDVVFVTDRIAAYFTARVVLLEQWAAYGEPVAVLIHNFSGSLSWENYVLGVADLFEEAGLEMPKVSGSTETNMALLQSAIGVTMIGAQREMIVEMDLEWFSYGVPLVGPEVMENPEMVASVKKIQEAIATGIVQRIWPVGSGGILQEFRNLTNNPLAQVECVWDVEKTAGPSTVVLLAIPPDKIEEALVFFGEYLMPLSEVSAT